MSETATHFARFASADRYERLMGRWSRRLAPLLLAFVNPDENSAHLLDVGCGTGSLTFALSEQFPAAKIHGIDLSEELVRHARLINPAPARIHFDQGDAAKLPYDNHCFDATFASLVLNFLPDAKAITEMVRVTKPGGTVAASVWDIRGGLSTMRMVLDTAAAIDQGAVEYRSKFHAGLALRPGEIGDLWRAAGLKEVETRTLTIRMDFESFEDMWEPLALDSVFASYLRSVPLERQQQIEEKVRAAYLGGDADGHRSFAASAWAAKGRAPYDDS